MTQAEAWRRMLATLWRCTRLFPPNFFDFCAHGVADLDVVHDPFLGDMNGRDSRHMRFDFEHLFAIKHAQAPAIHSAGRDQGECEADLLRFRQPPLPICRKSHAEYCSPGKTPSFPECRPQPGAP